MRAKQKADVISIQDAMKILKIGRNAMYDGCARGEIPHTRIGRLLRFSRASLIEWLTSATTLKKSYSFKGTRRGGNPKLEGKVVQRVHPRDVNVSFDVTQEVAAALRALRDTGFFGNGVDCASVAEELLRRALLDETIVPYWRKS